MALLACLSTLIIAFSVAAQDETADDASDPVAIVHVEPSAAELAALKQRIARSLTRIVLTLSAADNWSSEAINITIPLIEQAIALDPENPDHWRHMLSIATLIEDRQARLKAMERLLEFDPDDTVLQLMQHNARIDALQTVEERTQAYANLLQGPGSGQMHPAIRSRLAMDYALLLRRIGDVDGFARWLAEATAVDSSNRDAASMAAGYFMANVENALAEAELLVNVILADPLDRQAHLGLAQLLLETGAYEASTRFYDLALDSAEAHGGFITHAHIADVALAYWGAGDVEGALRTIRTRQRELNLVLANERRAETPGLSSLELALKEALLPPLLATLRAVIQHRADHPDAQASYEKALASFDAGLKSIETGNRSAAGWDVSQMDAQELLLQKAWLEAWVGGDATTTEAALEVAEEAGDIEESLRQRALGWAALSRGDVLQAIEMLTPLAEEGDGAAGLGLGLALIEDGRRRDGARELLNVARAQPGTAIGVYAVDLLAELLDQRMSISEEASALTALVDTIPNRLRQIATDPRQGVTLKVQPASRTFAPFEPIRLELVLHNHTSFPIGIDREGPIRPQVVVLTDLQLTRALENEPMPPVVVDINRSLRIEPRSSISVPVDLHLYRLGATVERNPVQGGLIKIRAISNFISTQAGALGPGVLRPGPMGVETTVPPLRVDGVRISPEWIQQALDELADPDKPIDIDKVVILLHIAIPSPQLAPAIDMLEPEIRDAVIYALPGIYQSMSEIEFAAFLSTVPPRQITREIRERLINTDERLPRVMYLLYLATRLTDPVLEASRNSDDPLLRDIAVNVDASILRIEEQRRLEAQNSRR